MIIAGIDYSLNGPAICVFNTGYNFEFANCNFYFLSDIKKYSNTFLHNIHGENFKAYNEESERYDSISDWVMGIVAGIDQVSLEGYAYSAQGRVFNIAENTGILKYKLWQSRIPVEVIPPSAVKKAFCGRGNGDKNAMYDAWLKETGIDLLAAVTPNKQNSLSPVSDIVDSYAICKILASLVKCPKV